MRRQLLVCTLAVLGLLLGAGTAFAHDVLTNSDPPDGSSRPTGPQRITLTYDLPVQESFSTITVLGPDGLHYEAAPSQVDGNVVSAPVNPLGPAGRYTVGYRIVSDDGHPVSGSVSFTLTQPGSGHGVPGAEPSADPAQPAGSGQDSGSGGLPVWLWVAVGVLLVAAGATVAMRLGKGGE